MLGLEALVFTVLKVMVFAPFFVSNGSKLWDLTVGTSFAILSMMRIQSNISYSKGRRGREAFSIHPWMASQREENPGRNK
jgi:hypothetical protein